MQPEGELISGTKALILKREIGNNECRPCQLVTVNDDVCIAFNGGGLFGIKVCNTCMHDMFSEIHADSRLLLWHSTQPYSS